MLGELAVFQADDVGGNPGGRAAVARETAVGDDVVAFGHDQLLIVAQRLPQREPERPVTKQVKENDQLPASPAQGPWKPSSA
jgi:hypothetical protein